MALSCQQLQPAHERYSPHRNRCCHAHLAWYSKGAAELADADTMPMYQFVRVLLCACREDILLPAVGMHVAPALTQHLKEDEANSCCVRVVLCACREDIHLAAVDMHVAPALTQHLKEQPQLRAAVRSMVAASTSGGLAVGQALQQSGCAMFCLGVEPHVG